MNPRRKNISSAAGEYQVDRHIPLRKAARLVRVPYHTFTTANREGRLKLIRRKVGAKTKLFIEVIVLVEYMIYTVRTKYRWKSQILPVSWIATRPELQPRCQPNEPELLRKLEAHLASGGATEPIWCIRSCREITLIDGARRLLAHQRGGRKSIRAIIIRLPFAYAATIAYERNTRHAANLTVADQQKRVATYLAAHPGEKQAMEEGKLTQARLAELIGVSEPTLSRFLTKESATKPQFSVDGILCELGRILAKYSRGKLTDSESDQLIVIGLKAFAVLYDEIPSSIRKKVKQSIESGSTDLARDLSPRLRACLDRRGGDRRSRSRKQTTKS